MSDLSVTAFDGRTATVHVRTSTPENVTLAVRYAEGTSRSALTPGAARTLVLSGATSYARSVDGGFTAPGCGKTVYRQVTVSTTPTAEGGAATRIVSVKGDPCPPPSVDNVAVEWNGHSARIIVRTGGPGPVGLAAEFTRREGEGSAQVVDRASRTLSGDTDYRLTVPASLGEVACGTTAYFGVRVTTEPSAANGPQSKEVRVDGVKCAPPTVSITSWNGTTLGLRVTSATPDPVSLSALFQQTTSVGERTVTHTAARQARLAGDSTYNRLYTVRFATPRCGYVDIRRVTVKVSSALGSASDSAKVVRSGRPCADPTPQPTSEPTKEPTKEPTRTPTGEPNDQPSDEPN